MVRVRLSIWVNAPIAMVVSPCAIVSNAMRHGYIEVVECEEYLWEIQEAINVCPVLYQMEEE